MVNKFQILVCVTRIAMPRKRRLSFNVEIFPRYKRPENQRLSTFATVDDSWSTKHELTEEMFLEFLYLVQQEQTNYEALDKFLQDKSEDLESLRIEQKRMRAEKEARDLFEKYDRSIWQRSEK